MDALPLIQVSEVTYKSCRAESDPISGDKLPQSDMLLGILQESKSLEHHKISKDGSSAKQASWCCQTRGAKYRTQQMQATTTKNRWIQTEDFPGGLKRTF
jgi:hypothetical protein